METELQDGDLAVYPRIKVLFQPTDRTHPNVLSEVACAQRETRAMANPEHLRILEQGVEVWDTWREQHTDIEPDLSEANLRGADLGRAYLRGAALSEAALSGANLSEANLSEADL